MEVGGKGARGVGRVENWGEGTSSMLPAVVAASTAVLKIKLHSLTAGQSQLSDSLARQLVKLTNSQRQESGSCQESAEVVSANTTVSDITWLSSPTTGQSQQKGCSLQR